MSATQWVLLAVGSIAFGRYDSLCHRRGVWFWPWGRRNQRIVDSRDRMRSHFTQVIGDVTDEDLMSIAATEISWLRNRVEQLEKGGGT